MNQANKAGQQPLARTDHSQYNPVRGRGSVFEDEMARPLLYRACALPLRGTVLILQ